MELDSEDSGAVQTGNVKKNINIKLKSAPKTGRGRGRPRKDAKAKKENQIPPDNQDAGGETDQVAVGEEMMEPTIFKQPGEPLHQNQHLRWNHKVNLLGEKVVDPLIHCCEKCLLPILIYGRMIPCKHVFCFDCARKTDKTCPRCEEPVSRIEQSALGTVFICNHGGPKHGTEGCRRTYLSSRDLQAHIYHRHIRDAQQSAPPSVKPSSVSKSLGSSSNVPAPQPNIEKYSTSKSSSKVHEGNASMIEQYTTAAGRHGVPDMSMGQNRPPPAGDTPRMYPPAAMLNQMTPMGTGPPMMGQGPPPQIPNSSQPPPMGIPPPQLNATQHDAYSLSGVMPGGRTNLITIQVQDDQDYRRRDQPNYMQAGVGGIPPVTFSTALPPPGGNMPPLQTNYNPALQHPPSFSMPPSSVPLPFSSPPINSSGNLPHPPPPNVPGPNLGGPPPHLGPRMPMPGNQPPRFGGQGHFDGPNPPGGQNPRGPWNGPPQRGPPPHGGSGPRGPPPQFY
ncbi:hypothetical protein FSP39_007269 [Pinctada imbricata]|uniref:E3 ubiquitin-protein ligase Hakai n=1 Tax=Pinctada imbricata TaxID=66713 RepID=A0AA89C5H8_PINIB|nr:hypothetical protein FSP39_007269 [Pinctada imbricata]